MAAKTKNVAAKTKNVAAEAETVAAEAETVAAEAETVAAEPAVETIDQLKSNMIALANDLCERVHGKAIDTDTGVDKIVALYNAVK